MMDMKVNDVLINRDCIQIHEIAIGLEKPLIDYSSAENALASTSEQQCCLNLNTSSHHCHIEVPWSISYFLTSKGAENFHVYLWIAKDFGWAQDYRNFELTAGGLALLWCFLLFYHAMLLKRNGLEDAYMIFAMSVWLGGNYSWAAGEVISVRLYDIYNQ